MKQLKVLIVDDEVEIAEVLALRLARKNMQVANVANGLDCLDFLKKELVDIVLLDMKMPSMNGLQVLDEITKKYPQIAVIMLSGLADLDASTEALSKGAFYYELKPIDLDALCNKIEDSVEQKKLEN